MQYTPYTKEKVTIISNKNITIEQPFNNKHTKYIKKALIIDLDNLEEESTG